MNYQETVDFLFSQLPVFQSVGQKAFNNKLDKSLDLDTYFGHPHQAYKCIHVGGTNGKGSVAHLIASVLQSAGYKVGLYTSPHLKDFRERIKVNGTPCSEDFVVNFVAKNKEILEEVAPSFFEMTVAMSFQYFKEQQVDIAVIEVGLGGRLDSTNIISPILSIITNISIDHTAMLGNSLVEIATEKAGIIKQDIPVVIGESQVQVSAVFERAAKQKNASLCYADREQGLENIKKTSTKIQFDWKDIKGFSCPLFTDYQQKNIQTSLVSLNTLRKRGGLSISNQAIIEGFQKVVKQTQFKGRWQVLGTEPLVICDTAHNEAGIAVAMAELQKIPYKALHFVYGTSADKDLTSIMPMLPKDAIYYFTQAKVLRAMSAKDLQKKASVFHLHGKCFATVSSALENAMECAEKEDVIYIGGSIFVVAELDL